MPLLEGGAAGGLGPRDLEEMGVGMVAVNILELALSPGFAAISAVGGLGGFSGWNGVILPVTYGDLQPAARGGDSGLRARRPPAILSDAGDEMVVRSEIDGSMHHLTHSALEAQAADLGVASWKDVAPEGTEVSHWESIDQPLRRDCWVVSGAPAEAGREGRYWTPAGWAEIAEITDAAIAAPLVDGCACRACVSAHAGYIAHLWSQHEITAAHLLGAHNLHSVRSLVEV